jgi:hypothetical protein
MARTQHVRNDAARRQIQDALATYARQHQEALIAVRRQNSVSLRIRIIDPDFRGLDRLKREDFVWELLDRLPNRIRSQITFVLLLTPEEQAESLLDQDFENPTPSRF